jgi:uncharacterized protein
MIAIRCRSEQYGQAA